MAFARFARDSPNSPKIPIVFPKIQIGFPKIRSFYNALVNWVDALANRVNAIAPYGILRHPKINVILFDRFDGHDA